MVKILHLADLHLGWQPAFLGSKAAEWQEERDNLLTAIVDQTLGSGLDIGLTVIAGDLFDCHTPPQKLVTKVMEQIQRLMDHNIKVVTVPGNHDEITYPDSVYRRQTNWPGILVNNPHPDHVATLEINGEPCHIYSLAYTGGLTPTGTAIDSFPHNKEKGWHIAVFHGSLDWDTGDRSLPLSSKALGSAEYDYIALGHIHKPARHSLPHGIAVYPGSIAGKGFNDPGCGQLTVATLTGGEVEVDKIKLGGFVGPVCRALIVDIGLYYSPDELAEGIIAGSNPGEIVSLRLTGTPNFAIDAEHIKGLLADKFYYLEVVDCMNSYSPSMLQGWTKEHTLRGLFVQRMQKRLAEAKGEQERRRVTRAIVNALKALDGDE